MAVYKYCDVALQGQRKTNEDHPSSFQLYLVLLLKFGTLIQPVVSQLVVHDTAFTIHQPMNGG